MGDRSLSSIIIGEENVTDDMPYTAKEQYGRYGVRLDMEEMEHGGLGMYREMAEKGIKFLGTHYSGMDYPACMFLSTGNGVLDEIDAIEKDGEFRPYADVEDAGEIDAARYFMEKWRSITFDTRDISVQVADRVEDRQR